MVRVNNSAILLRPVQTTQGVDQILLVCDDYFADDFVFGILPPVGMNGGRRVQELLGQPDLIDLLHQMGIGIMADVVKQAGQANVFNLFVAEGKWLLCQRVTCAMMPTTPRLCANRV